MVMADTELNGNARHLSLAPPPMSLSDLNEDSDTPTMPPPAPLPSEAAPKRRPGRPPGTKNGQGKKAKLRAKAPAPAAKKPFRGKGGGSEFAPKTQAKKGELVRVRSKELKARAAQGDADALSLIKRIQRAHQKWTSALAKKAQVSTECGQRVKSAEAAFTNAIEAPLEVTRVETAAYREKLEACTVRWQEWSEAKAQNIEERKGARDDVQAALEGLNEAIEESRQQSLPGLR